MRYVIRLLAASFVAMSLTLLGFQVSPALASSDTLSAGQSLSAGQALWSSDGSYEAIMQTDGNFVVYAAGGKPVWWTGTATPGSRIVMQADGNLVVYAPGGQALWWSGTSGGNWNASAVMQTDGNFVVYAATARPLWSWKGGRTGLSGSTLFAGQSLSAGQGLWSSDGSYEAIMQTDGNFVEYGPSGVVWDSGTRVAGSHIAMQTDGNLVIYPPSGAAVWSTSTHGAGGIFALQTDSNSVIYFAGTALWSSNRNHGKTSSSDPNAGPDAGQCTYWAGYEWDQATGSWPDITGNADQWATNGASAGFTVTPRPEPRSIVVFPDSDTPGFPGHVAWVTSVARNSNGSISVSISEMNHAGLGVVDTRTITNSPELRYILAPYSR
jgi:surface antigen